MQKRPMIMFLLGILILCFCFASNYKMPLIEEKFEEEVDGKLRGTIYHVDEKEKTNTIYLKEVEILSIGNENLEGKGYYCDKIIVYDLEKKKTTISSEIIVSGVLQKFQNASNPGQFDEKSYYHNKNISYKMLANAIDTKKTNDLSLENFLYKGKKKIQEVYSTIYDAKDMGIISAIILGDKTFLDNDIKELYQKNGIAHIIAISGV